MCAAMQEVSPPSADFLETIAIQIKYQFQIEIYFIEMYCAIV